MIKIKNLDVYGIDHCLRAMRNPMNSWNKSDSNSYDVGDKDKELLLKLTKAGTEHRKCLRMIQVWCDITAPRYWWTEFDTYKIGVTRNSCSTMHKLFDKDRPIETSDFSYTPSTKAIILSTVYELNKLREDYFNADNQLKKNELLRQAKAILPEGYMQKATVNLNYEVILNIYRQRKNHRLPEWQDLIGEFKKLPLIPELIDCL